MSKQVFKPMDIAPSNIKVFIKPPEFIEQVEQKKSSDELEEYDGKTIEELKIEAEAFEKSFETKKQEMIQKAEADADEIREKAKNEGFELIRVKGDEAKIIIQRARDEAETILKDANIEADKIQNEMKNREQDLLEDARRRGYKDGLEEGINSGTGEVKRLVERVQTILNASIEKRNEIFVETEQQIIGLVLLIAKKVIKVMSENQKNVVINNVVQALRKLRSRGEVVIRVNTDDIELATQHKRDFVEMVEGVKGIRILEDSSVERGGCIIETDFGEIDAKISSQLHEIEERIVEIVPIISKDKEEKLV